MSRSLQLSEIAYLMLKYIADPANDNQHRIYLLYVISDALHSG
jgi:hypothetical protein